MRKLNFAIALVLISSVLPVIAASKPIPGKPCQKVGSSQIFNGAKYTCVKSGKKISWSKPSKITAQPSPTTVSSEKPTPSPPPTSLPTTPTPEPIQSPTPSSSQSGTPSIEVAIFNSPCNRVFQTIMINGKHAMCTNIQGKLIWAEDTQFNILNIWTQAKDLATSKTKAKVNLSPYFAHNVNVPLAEDLLNRMIKAAQYWQDEYLPKTEIPVLFFSEFDKKWYEETLSKLVSDRRCIDPRLIQFDEEIVRNGSNANAAGFNGCNDIFWYEFFIGSTNNGKSMNFLKVGAHEYTHGSQFEVLTSKNSNFAPCWFIEGGADFYGTVLGASSEDEVIKMRAEQVWNHYGNGFNGLADELSQGWEVFLEENGPRSTNSRYDADCGINGSYAVGAAATEYLYLLKGKGGEFKFKNDIKENKDFKAAIQRVYGINWDQMKINIANYIRLIAAQTPKL